MRAFCFFLLQGLESAHHGAASSCSPLQLGHARQLQACAQATDRQGCGPATLSHTTFSSVSSRRDAHLQCQVIWKMRGILVALFAWALASAVRADCPDAFYDCLRVDDGGRVVLTGGSISFGTCFSWRSQKCQPCNPRDVSDSEWVLWKCNAAVPECEGRWVSEANATGAGGSGLSMAQHLNRAHKGPGF